MPAAVTGFPRSNPAFLPAARPTVPIVRVPGELGGSLMSDRNDGPRSAELPGPRGPMTSERTDDGVLGALRGGDETVFAEIVDSWSRPMLHVARGYVSTQDSAQEVVQDTWLAVIRGLDRFEGRSSLRTWVFRILVNTAKTRGMRESRTLPFASLSLADDDGPTVDPARFRGAD